jgi:hypothetical protein
MWAQRDVQIATVSQRSQEKVFPKEVYSAHGVLMGIQLGHALTLR